MEWHDYRTDKPTEEGEYFVQKDYTEFTGNVTRTFYFDAYTNGRFQSEPLKPCGWSRIVAWMKIEPFEKRTRFKCGACGKVFDEAELIYLKDPDELKCPRCGDIEPGFSEVKDDE